MLLVGFESSDDAAVYQLSENTALVTSADFITPPVDDPFLFGQIGAANSISDIYAMGGKPLICLNLIGFPSKKLGQDVLAEIIEGALSKITEAGAVLAGGHTIEDDEPKFGLSVTGIVHPGRYWSNKGALPGDTLILTKPVGSGVLLNANLKKWVSKQAIGECLQIISTLNNIPSDIMKEFEIHAVTDVTGFGLAGHAFEMANASKVTIEIHLSELPIMMEAIEMYEKGVTTSANHDNRAMVERFARFDKGHTEWHEEVLFDPQTNGGLLISIPSRLGKKFLQILRNGGVEHASIIGQVMPFNNFYLRFV